MTQNKLGNPAVVGLAGFGITTLMLQFHNVGWCGIGPVWALAVVYLASDRASYVTGTIITMDGSQTPLVV